MKKRHPTKTLADVGKIRDDFRPLTADFAAADDNGNVALDLAAAKEAEAVARQKRLSERLIELRKHNRPKR